MGAAAFRLKTRTASDSVETRFLALLDADEEQLAYRLRQMITLMSSADTAPDWGTLFRDLTNWNRPNRFVQVNWARDYYKHQVPDAEDDEVTGRVSSDHGIAGSEGTKSDLESQEG